MDAVTPSTPTPDTTTLVGSVVRSVLLLLSGLGLYHGTMPDASTLSLIASVAVGLGSAGWSLWTKFREAAHTHDTAVASAVEGAAVQPTK